MSEEKLIRNWSGMYDPEKIVKELVSFGGLFDRILWKHFRALVYSTPVENSIHILNQVYGLHNAERIFPKKLIRKEFDRVSETVFRVIKSDGQ